MSASPARKKLDVRPTPEHGAGFVITPAPLAVPPTDDPWEEVLGDGEEVTGDFYVLHSVVAV
jgi:hypothetical protein